MNRTSRTLGMFIGILIMACFALVAVSLTVWALAAIFRHIG